MNAGHTTERVHDALRRMILDRQFRPGARLDPATLSSALSSSVTPVRDALHLLTGQGLVEARPGEGFYLPQLDAPALQDLYAWNAELLVLALRSKRPGDGHPDKGDPASLSEGTAVEATARIFAEIGRRSRNIEHRRAIAAVNDRLHAARIAEVRVLDDIDAEVAELRAALAQDAAAPLRRLIVAYHRRRLRVAADIVWTLYRNGDRH